MNILISLKYLKPCHAHFVLNVNYPLNCGVMELAFSNRMGESMACSLFALLTAGHAPSIYVIKRIPETLKEAGPQESRSLVP